jgi:outer membrane protein OmpA-like peptidoglycan-associated protein
MKKIFIALALTAASLNGFAQDEVPLQKHSVATNSFWSNWFFQVGGDWNVWYSNQEHSADNHNGMGFLGSERRTFGGAVALGKWFTPGIGLRTKFQAWKGKNIPALTAESQKFDEWILNEQVMFNLSNLLEGYNPARVWNLIPFAGAGVARNMSADRYAMSMSVGLQSSWRVTRHLNLYLEAGWNRMEGSFDGVTEGLHDNKSRLWESKDNNIYAEVGITFNLSGSGWKKTPDVDAIRALSQSQIDALNAQLEDANAENARLASELEEKQAPADSSVGKVVVHTPVSVFFTINSAVVASRKDLVNVQAIADYAKANGSRIIVTGYADAATGVAEANQKLSDARAATVADELVKLGVDRSKITTIGKGGVSDLAPDAYNRRATVEVAE